MNPIIEGMAKAMYERHGGNWVDLPELNKGEYREDATAALAWLEGNVSAEMRKSALEAYPHAMAFDTQFKAALRAAREEG